MQLGNTEYPLHITEAYVDFETESLLHEAINVAAKHYVLEWIFMRQVSHFLFLFGWILIPPNGVRVAMEMQAEAKVKMEAIR